MSRIGHRRSRGQALLEFALVLPVLVFLLLGLFDLSRAIYAYNTLSNASATGARVAIVNQTVTSGSPCSATQSIKRCAAEQAVSLGIQSSAVTVRFLKADKSGTCTTIQLGCLAEVTVPYTFQPITPVIAGIVGTISMSSTSVEPIESTYP